MTRCRDCNIEIDFDEDGGHIKDGETVCCDCLVD